MSKIKVNFAYNLILTLSSYIVSFIVFPYVSRVLGVDLLGRVGFVDNVVSYFTLFSTLGISIIGVREIAACHDDRASRSRVFSALFTMLLGQTLTIVLIFILSIFLVPRFAEVRNLMFVGSIALLSTSLLIEWFYQGIENFKYIAIRTLSVRLLYAVAVFLIIKGPEDYLAYFCLTSGVALVNALVNILYARHFVDIRLELSQIKNYVKPFFSLGLYRLMVSMYTTFNVIFLGFVCTEDAVGCYYVATKVYSICLGVMTAFTSVMMPRMSSLLSNNRTDEFSDNIHRSFEVFLSASLPLVIGSVVLTESIISLLSGAGYEGAVTPMRIIMPVILISGMAQIWVIQVLMPMKKDSVILKGAIIGAVVGIISNILFVRHLGAVGSALALLLSELTGNSYTFIYVLRNKLMLFPSGLFLKTLFLSLPYLAFCTMAVIILGNSLAALSISLCLCGIYFIALNRKYFIRR